VLRIKGAIILDLKLVRKFAYKKTLNKSILKIYKGGLYNFDALSSIGSLGSITCPGSLGIISAILQK